MQLSGFTDEAGKDLETQIKATKELGWSHLSARSINGTNIHELPEDEFEQVADRLDEEGIKVVEFGSLIGNWAKSIASDFDITLAEIDRAIPRMHRLKTKFIRIMSYAMEPWGEDQQDVERIRRVREITKRFSDAGLQAIHENCQNYGGFSAEHTLRLVDEVPGLKLVFDTGNPVFTRDRSKPEPHPWQDALEFYQAVKEHVVHVHIKDCLNPPEGSTEPAKYTMPGEGQARLLETIRQMKADGYTGGFAIEPHVATVFHVQDGQEPDWQQCYDSFVAYGRAFEEMLSQLDR
jgi:sugar phosphate isomerase/epimerase